MRYYYIVYVIGGDKIGFLRALTMSFDGDFDFVEFHKLATKNVKSCKGTIIKFFTEISEYTYNTYTEYLKINN